MNFRKFFLTVGFSGLFPKAPGTVGSLVSLFLAIPVLYYFDSSTLFLLALLITVISVKQINIYEKEVGEHDSKEIVIDELAGMWIALSICNINMENTTHAIILGVLAFIFFRVFDIWKPSIIGKIDEKVEGGWGVMGDDVLAGIAGGVAAGGVYQLLLNFL